MSGMVPAVLPVAHETSRIRADARPTPAFREQLRRIPSWKNLWSVVFLDLQTGALVWATAAWGPGSWPITFVLMGRAFAQFASLMHEAAHRLLFSNKRANDLVGRWLLGFPTFTSTDAYRRVHMAHHRDEFGPDEPDIPLYIGYPIGAASFRRKLMRDATGRTGIKLMRGLLMNARSKDQRVRRTFWKIMLVQAVLLAAAIAAGYWWLYPFFWLAPYLTVWRVINRLRSVAEHGGMQRSPDRRESTHTVRQHVVARFLLVPYRIGWHLAHHVDSGVPFRNLPQLHDALREAGYIDESFEYPSYPAIWKALRAEPIAA
ncbi:MAG: fatty acid desaturase family protein [Actinobacteria bacterium]|nr:fatty acid desaturase family protein [Actinomycetota bacterium]